MKNENLLKRVWYKIFPQRAPQQVPIEDAENRARVRSLLQMVEHTEENELSCDEVFALLDQYVELVVEQRQAADLLPLVKKHLDRCKDCHEEYEALVRVIEGKTDTGG
jgi:predicted component of type VI protein secretion system